MTEDNIIFNQSLGKKIKSRRLELKKTQTWLAKKLGVTFQQIQKYEKGVNGTNPYNLLKIANALRVSILYFYLDVSTSCRIDPTVHVDKNASIEPLILTKEMEVTDDQSASG